MASWPAAMKASRTMPENSQATSTLAMPAPQHEQSRHQEQGAEDVKRNGDTSGRLVDLIEITVRHERVDRGVGHGFATTARRNGWRSMWPFASAAAFSVRNSLTASRRGLGVAARRSRL